MSLPLPPAEQKQSILDLPIMYSTWLLNQSPDSLFTLSDLERRSGHTVITIEGRLQAYHRIKGFLWMSMRISTLT